MFRKLTALTFALLLGTTALTGCDKPQPQEPAAAAEAAKPALTGKEAERAMLKGASDSLDAWKKQQAEKQAKGTDTERPWTPGGDEARRIEAERAAKQGDAQQKQ